MENAQSDQPGREATRSLGAVGGNTGSVIAGYLAALTSGDLDLIRSHFAEDATWTIHGDLPVSGTYRGSEAIMTFLANAMSGLFAPDTQRFTFTNTLIAGDTAIVEWNVSGVGAISNAAYDNDYCGLFSISEGRISAVREYFDSDHARHVLFPTTRGEEAVRT